MLKSFDFLQPKYFLMVKTADCVYCRTSCVIGLSKNVHIFNHAGFNKTTVCVLNLGESFDQKTDVSGCFDLIH